jgi:hypothetical protein
MASEESLCDHCYYDGECEIQEEAKKYNKEIQDCPEFLQEGEE